MRIYKYKVNGVALLYEINHDYPNKILQIIILQIREL